MNNIKIRALLVVLLLIPLFVSGQDQADSESVTSFEKYDLFGFVRGGLYTGFDYDNNNKPFVSGTFSDFGLKVDVANGLSYKAFADLRFRYGVEFKEAVNKVELREAYVKINGTYLSLSVGQQIVKWGRADFTNPTSKFSPQNLISRSPDREDMNLGNILSVVNWFPTEFMNIEAVLSPFYRSSVLLIDPLPLPSNVSIETINDIITTKAMVSYGIKTDFYLKGSDLSLMWYEGYEPMPGTALSKFDIDMSGQVPVPVIELKFTPYKTRMLGFDFETTIKKTGFRGEAALVDPYLASGINEFVPWPEIKIVVGADWSSGLFRITGEYSGKIILSYSQSTVEPVIGTEPDYSKLAELIQIPGFDLESYVRQQVGAFNRLYNYQLEKKYNSAGVRLEADLIYGKLTPSVFSMLNFTTRDFLIIPEIKIKPADGYTITAGAEFYHGRSGSLYDIINEFMNCIYVSFKADF